MAVALVATSQGVGALLDLELGRVFEHARVVACSPVGFVMGLGAEVARPGRGRVVVLRLVVRSSVKHGTGAKASAPRLH